MKQVFSILIILLSSGILFPETALAQKLNYWKGGQAGRQTDWNCPRNWSLGKVPDQTCVAVIEQNFRNGSLYPVISTQVETVWYLMVLPGARLEIGPSGRIEFELPDACLFEGDLVNRGQIIAGAEGYAQLQFDTK